MVRNHFRRNSLAVTAPLAYLEVPPWAWGKTASYPSAWQAGKVDLMPLVARQLLLSDWVARQGLKTAGRRIHGSPWSSEASTWCPVQVLRVSKPPDMRCTFPSWCEEIVLEPPTLGLNPTFYPWCDNDGLGKSSASLKMEGGHFGPPWED